jgi:hypothetical protein
MRDVEIIDSELRLVAALRRAARERGGPLPSIDVADALLGNFHNGRRTGGTLTTSIVTDVPQEEQARIDAVEHRLAQKYSEVPHDRVSAVVQRVYARFTQSTVRDYVPLLVERRAREELIRSTAGQAVFANAGRAVAASEIVDVRLGTRNDARPRWARLSARFRPVS